MKHPIAAVCLLAAIAGWSSAAPRAAQQPTRDGTLTTRLEPFDFVVGTETMVVERGVVTVPERRAATNSRPIELHFLRFRSTADRPGHPIVFLAGGPGGSGIAAARSVWPTITALRQFGDVIALDQRGSGQSNAVPECVTDRRLGIAEPLVFARMVQLLTLAAADCARFWRERGVDVSGYTTVESARDLDDLRRALGAEKINLWGISYGSRLAITAIRGMPGRIDRAILASVEPPHATIKLPQSLDVYVARLQAVVQQDPAAAAAYPDVAGLLRRVHRRLDGAPLRVTASDGRGEPATFLFGGDEMRMLGSGGLTDPGTAAQVLSIYAALDAGQPPPATITPTMLRFRRRLDPITFDAMAAMDYTAGISRARLTAVRGQAATSIFGDYQSYEQEVRAAFGLADLGDDYRTPVTTDVPTLVLTGTLDARFDSTDETETLTGFRRLSPVTVTNGGHNLLAQDPAIREVIVAFMRGHQLPRAIEVPPPTFVR